MSFKIINEYKDFTIGGLILKMANGDIVTQPGYQRGYVYDEKKASYLIESIILDMPIPTIYLCEEVETYEVIDGQQRLETVKRFYNNEFALKGLKLLTELNGKKFKDLDKKTKRNFEDFCFKTTIIRPNSTATKFELFERLNIGSTPLKAQEIRNCVYRGEFNEMIKEMVQDDKIRKCLFKPTRVNKRMKFEEEVLLLIWYREMIKKCQPIKSYTSKTEAVNVFMETVRDLSKNEVETFYKENRYVFRECFDLFGELMYNVGNRYLIVDIFNSFPKVILRKYQEQITNIIKEITTNNVEYINLRNGALAGHLNTLTKKHNIVKDEIEKLIKEDIEIQKENEKNIKKSFDCKKEIYIKQNGICAICGQKMHDIDFIEFDKKLSKNNTEFTLVHRYCNRSKQRSLD